MRFNRFGLWMSGQALLKVVITIFLLLGVVVIYLAVMSYLGGFEIRPQYT